MTVAQLPFTYAPLMNQAGLHRTDRRNGLGAYPGGWLGDLSGGIVTVIKYGPILVFLREAKPLKTRIVTVGESPRFRSIID